MRHYLAEPFQNDLDFIYFISFALKNTEKKNTEDMHNNTLIKTGQGHRSS